MDLQETLTTIATSGVVTGFLVFGARTWFKAGLDNHYKKKIQDLTHEYDKKLAKFNAKIAKEAADRQEDFQRKIYDFTMYSAKKHELYPEIFKQIHEIQYNFQQLDKFSSVNILEGLTSKDKVLPFFQKLANVINSRAISDVVSDEEFRKVIQTTTEFDFEDCTELARGTFIKALSNEILKHIRIFDNLFILNLLYFSDEAAHYIQDIKFDFYKLSKETNLSDEDKNQLKLSLEQKINGLRGILKKEISVGYYSS